jgi:hypothetical protein
MAMQNLVSAVFTPEAQAGVTQGITGIKSKMDFLIILQPNQKNQLMKVGDIHAGFIKDAQQVMSDHPDIMSPLFNLTEFQKDCSLSESLAPILNQLAELTESVEDTLFAANSDSMCAALEVYGAVQANKDKVPGMDTIAAKMAAYFKKPKRTTLSAAAKQQAAK